MKTAECVSQLGRILDLHKQVADNPDRDPAQERDVEALKMAIQLIASLDIEGIRDGGELLDYFNDYKGLEKERRQLRFRYEVPMKPIYKDSVLHCPECNHRVSPGHAHCHWCGKKLVRS